MSVQATNWVWEHSASKGNTRLVLLAIADAANREGKQSWQSAATIADMCKISSRTVQRCIADLLESGELQKDGVSGEFHTNVYSLPGVLTGEPLRQNDVPRYDTADVRQNDVYDNSGEPLRQNEHAATTTMSYNPINPSITNVIHPSSGAPSAQPTHNRGTRLPENFMPDQKHIDKIRHMKPGLDLDLEHTKFKNYWLSATGKNATKKDWGRTWENWMLNAKTDNDYKPGWQRRAEFNTALADQYDSSAWTGKEIAP